MEMRPATKKKLGAVIVGEGFNVTNEGVLSVDEEKILKVKFVEFTRKRLDEIFEQSKLGDGEE